MSEIKNSALDQYGTELFKQQQFGTAGVEGVKQHEPHSGYEGGGSSSGHEECIRRQRWMLAGYSSEDSISSCLRTLVWLVSRISPARNISSTTLYTCTHCQWCV